MVVLSFEEYERLKAKAGETVKEARNVVRERNHPIREGSSDPWLI